MNLVFDLECDGLLDTLTTVWCIGVLDVKTGQRVLYKPDQIQDALDHLSNATELYAHNGIGFDFVVLKRLYGWEPSSGCRVVDTMLWSQFLFSDLKANDSRTYSEEEEFDLVIGSHSLKAWGQRLGVHKGDFDGPWDRPSEEMFSYCMNDCVVTEHVRRHFASLNRTNPTALDIEHQFARIVQRQEQHGIAFDVDGAVKLHADLVTQISEVEQEIVRDIPPTITEMKTPQYWEVTWPDTTTQKFITKSAADAERKSRKVRPKDCLIAPGPLQQKVTYFNIGSRDQVRELLYARHQWVSPSLTEGGEKLVGTMNEVDLARSYGKLSEEVLRDCPFPIGQKLADYYLMKKIDSFLQGQNGTTGWLTLARNGRLHHRCMSIGCATMRVSCSKPNLSQTPHTCLDRITKKPLFGLAGRFGADCRRLFRASPGKVFIGADLSGIEAVMLASYLYPYDGGKYAYQVLNGDIHTMNMNAIASHTGFKISRSDVKTAFYGYAYSAGDMKLGHILMSTTKEALEEFTHKRDFYRRNPATNKRTVWSVAVNGRRTATPDEAALIDIGSQIREALETGIEGLGELIAVLKQAAKKGYLNVLDRQVPIRAARAALNTLLQSSAAMVAKKWVCLTDEYCIRDHIEYDPLMFIHDEFDSESEPQFADPYEAVCRKAMKDAGEYYKIRLEVRGTVQQGSNWLETH